MTDSTGKIDTQRNSPAVNYIKWMQQAAEAGKGPVALIRELSKFMFGKGKLQPEEFFMYGLYDDRRYTPEVKRTFVGINGPTVPSPWPEIVNDKLTLTALLRGMDLPTPEVQAIVHPTRTFGGADVLRTRDDVKRFLKDEAAYPIFGKPFDSACSLGTANITRYDDEHDGVVLSSGHTLDLDTLVDQIEVLGWRYQFQTLLRPHPDLVPILGDRVSTVRMFVLFDREGCDLLRASWKIPAVDNGADNFWRPGNMLAGIDVETGRIVKSVMRTPDGIEPINEHPETGASFENLIFPHWEAMRDVVMSAAPNLPGCYFQGWDVALTDRGPVLVELEGDGGDPIMEQLCFDSGLLQGRYLRFIDSAKEIEREKKAKIKARTAARLKNHFAQLANPHGASAPDVAEIDPREVQSAFENEQDASNTLEDASVSAGV